MQAATGVIVSPDGKPPMRLFLLRPTVAVVLASVLTLAGPVRPAVSDEYRVYSCKTPSGMPAPTDGWTATTGQAAYSTPQDNCGSGGALIAELNRQHAQPVATGAVTWVWAAPLGATIVGYRVWRSANALSVGEPGASPAVFVARPVNNAIAPYLAEECVADAGCPARGSGALGLAAPNLLSEDLRAVPGVNRWYINAACTGTVGQYCTARDSVMAIARVHGAEFTLRETDAPAVTDVEGRATGSATHTAVEPLLFTATDQTSGVYRAIVEVDGKVQRTTVLDDNGGHCADAGVDATTPYEFLYREPCPKTIRHELPIDTRLFADGTHSLRVHVEDAAGNRALVWSTTDFTVDNEVGATPPVVIGTAAPAPVTGTTVRPAATPGVAGDRGGASTSRPQPGDSCASAAGSTPLSARFASNDARTLIVSHGQAFSIAGRGPANTNLQIVHVRGSRTTSLGTVRTSATGTFARRLTARRGNGAIRLCASGARATLSLRVRAKVSFAVRITRGGLVRYSGRVSTGSIPRGGKIVAIQGHAGRSWQTFALRRTNAQGRFSGRYRLRVVWPGAKLRFRVRVPSEAGYPFLGVVGKALTRRVR